jgi:TrmH family RNA methyltransferase
MPAITSRENQTIKLIRRLLSSRKYRCESGLFVVEGVRLAAEAAAEKIAVKILLCTPQGQCRLGEEYAALLAAAEQCLVIDEALARYISDTQSPQGVFAVCTGMPTARALPEKTPGGCLVLASLQDPGNVGTILRSADAFGLSMVIMSSDCPDVSSPKVLRASMGAAFRVPVAIADPTEAVEHLKNKKIPVYAAALGNESASIGDVSLCGSAVVIGNEGSGLPQKLLSQCERPIMIPIAPGCESLNAAMAATVFCYEMSRAAGRQV